MNVRTTGMNRASTTALGPWRSKKATWGLITPSAPADVEPDLVAEHRGEHDAREQQPEIQLGLPGQDTRGEQQRIAGQEEPDQEPGLGEDDQPRDDFAVGADGIKDLLGVQSEDARDCSEHGASP